MAIASPNETTIKNLINTFQREVKKEILYDALQKMETDLKKVYDTLFLGPLPAVDASALFNLEAANLVGGPIPEEVLGDVALLGDVNAFTARTYIIGDEPVLGIGQGDTIEEVNSFVRIGQNGANSGFISLNLEPNFEDGNFGPDNPGSDGMLMELTGGGFDLRYLDGSTMVKSWGFNERTFTGHGPTEDITYIFCLIGDNDRFYLGESADPSGRGYVCFPAKLGPDLPTASPDNDGIIVLDRTANDLIYLVGGFRYRLSGTAF